MQINYNVSGSDRKQLVAAIAQHIGEKPNYLGVPSCAYQVGGYHISVDGKVTIEDNSTAAELIRFLREKGFLDECTDRLTRSAQKLRQEIIEKGLGSPYETYTNFVFYTDPDAESKQRFLRKNGVLIRKFGIDGGALRITAGNEEENKAVVDLLEQFT